MSLVGLRDVFVVAQSHHHHHHHHQESLFSSPDHQPPIPLFAQNPNPNPNPNPYLKKIEAFGATCQDCGNQAKKDCPHRRCRTCCKSRGFDCSTHVRSTWVPASRRRERQLGAPIPTPKKPRLAASDTSSSQQADVMYRENLPGQVKAPAVFKCVHVTSIEEEGEDEFVYQAMVKIGGHVFKGFLYDHGVDNNVIPNISELNLGGGASTSGIDLAGLLGGGADYVSRNKGSNICNCSSVTV